MARLTSVGHKRQGGRGAATLASSATSTRARWGGIEKKTARPLPAQPQPGRAPAGRLQCLGGCGRRGLGPLATSHPHGQVGPALLQLLPGQGDVLELAGQEGVVGCSAVCGGEGEQGGACGEHGMASSAAVGMTHLRQHGATRHRGCASNQAPAAIRSASVPTDLAGPGSRGRTGR